MDKILYQFQNFVVTIMCNGGLIQAHWLEAIEEDSIGVKKPAQCLLRPLSLVLVETSQSPLLH